MWKVLESRDRTDRTTMIESAKVAAYLNFITDIDLGEKQSTSGATIQFKIRDIIENTSNPTFSGIAAPDSYLINSETTKSFMTILVEEEAQIRRLEGTTETVGLLEVIKDTPVVRGILGNKFEKWFYSCIMGNISDNSVPPDIPEPMKFAIYTEACVTVAFKLCMPGARRAIQMSITTILDRSANMSIDSIMNNPDAMQDFQDGYASKGWAYKEYETKLRSVGVALECIDIDRRLAERMGNYTFENDVYVRALITFMKRKSVTGDGGVPTVIINTDTFADSKMSRNVKNAIKDAVDLSLSSYLDRMSSPMSLKESALGEHTINYLYILKSMIRPSGHRNTPFNKHMMAIQLTKFELYVRMCIERGVKRVDSDEMLAYRVPGYIARRIIRLNAVIGGRVASTSGEDMRDCLLNEGVPTSLIARVNYILRRLKNKYDSGSITLDNIFNNNMYMEQLLNYVIETYNAIVKKSVEGLEIRHTREAEKIGHATRLTPVEECTMVAADIGDGEFVAIEEDILSLIKNEMYEDIVANLLVCHSNRWGIHGYVTDASLRRLVAPYCLIGKCSLTARMTTESPFESVTTTSDYTITISSYATENTAIYNYLYVNRLPGGMAVLAQDGDDIFLFGILPKGTETINTYSVSEPNFINSDASDVPIYSISRSQARLYELSVAIGARPAMMPMDRTLGSIVIQQSYQRSVGGSNNIEDDDVFLVAASEMVRGGWSVNFGNIVLVLFAAWNCYDGDLTKAIIREVYSYILEHRSTDLGQMQINNSCSAAWTWLHMNNIHAGPNIDTERIARIVRYMGCFKGIGGSPTSFYSSVPRSIESLKNTRGSVSIGDFIRDCPSMIFIPPRENIIMPETIDDAMWPDNDSDNEL